MSDHYDALETRDPEQRERDLFAQLPEFMADAKAKAPGWASYLADVDPKAITSREALAQVPVFRKERLLSAQQDNPPFGGLTTVKPGNLLRLFMSPGPIFDPEGRGSDWWGVGRAVYAAGIRAGDILHNTFSYHLTPAGLMFESGAHAVGCAVIPAGIGNTEMQIDMIESLKPVGYAGTPDYLKVLLDKADEMGRDASSIKHGLVGGAALPASLRAELSERGVTVGETYGTADLGIIAYESVAGEGMVVNENLIVEIVRPGTNDPVAPGEVGEVVVTRFSKEYPLFRFGTGDMSAVRGEPGSCGRTNMRIKGWMGRADQRTKIKGMFVDPVQVNEIVKRHPEIAKARLVVDRENEQDTMTLLVEASNQEAGLSQAIEGSLREVTKMRGAVRFEQAGSLPNDGKVISDERDYG